MDIYLIRHGQTDFNVEHRLQGQMDTDLNEEGRAQAERGAVFLREHGVFVEKVYTSPLRRAVDTAEIMTGIPRSQFIFDERLKEIDFGPIEGMVWENVDKKLTDYVNDPWNNPPFRGIEPVPDLLKRTDEFLRDLAARDGGPVLIATHGMTLHALLVNMDGRNRWLEPAGNCTVYHSIVEGGHFSVPVRISDTGPTFG